MERFFVTANERQLGKLGAILAGNTKEQEAWSPMLDSIEELGDGTTVLR